MSNPKQKLFHYVGTSCIRLLFSAMYEPVRLILLKVVLEMELSVQKNRENHPAFHQEFQKRTRSRVTTVVYIFQP